MKEKKIYVVHFFNFFFNKNCESVCHVEASCEMEAAFIAHASFWKPQREFDFDDYTVYEYYPDSYLTRESVRWTDLESAEAIKKAMKKYVIENWNYCYKKKNDIDGLLEDCNSKFEITKENVLSIIRELEKQ